MDKLSALCRDLYLTHNTHKKQTFMPLVGFEPTNLAGERPQTHAFDRATTGNGSIILQGMRVMSTVTNREIKDSNILGCHAVYMGKYLLRFRKV
jgi:hypothetical protein